MMQILSGIFLILHGLVHFWYVTLSMGWVTFQEDMGWTGQSWLLSGWLGEHAARYLAAAGYALAGVLFAAAGALVWMNSESAGKWLVPAAVLSAGMIFLFWDGQLSLLVEKGLLGLVISLAVLIVLGVR
jgi:hypothetical protein